jgi:hypothetical protein
MIQFLLGTAFGIVFYHYMIVKKVWKKNKPPKVRLDRPPTLRKGCE